MYIVWPSPFCYFVSWTNLFATAEPHLIIKVILREHNIAEKRSPWPILNNNRFTSVWLLFCNLFNFIIYELGLGVIPHTVVGHFNNRGRAHRERERGDGKFFLAKLWWWSPFILGFMKSIWQRRGHDGNWSLFLELIDSSKMVWFTTVKE